MEKSEAIIGQVIFKACLNEEDKMKQNNVVCKGHSKRRIYNAGKVFNNQKVKVLGTRLNFEINGKLLNQPTWEGWWYCNLCRADFEGNVMDHYSLRHKKRSIQMVPINPLTGLIIIVEPWDWSIGQG